MTTYTNAATKLGLILHAGSGITQFSLTKSVVIENVILLLLKVATYYLTHILHSITHVRDVKNKYILSDPLQDLLHQ
jgi:hypothetical protein